MEKSRNTILIVLSFIAIYIIWGSTYLVNAFALEDLPAFRICGYRYTLSGILILIYFSIVGLKDKPKKVEIINSCKAGVIFIGLGTGGAIWALNFLDTGLTALIIAGEPLIIVFLIWIIKKRKPLKQTFTGIFLGMLGMYLLVSQNTLVSGDEQWIGVLVIFLSMIAWGLGSIFVTDAPLPSSPLLNSGIQMLVGGIITFTISFIIGEQTTPINALSIKTFWSILYLIIFGSIIAFTAFNYLLKNVATEKVVTNTYINPIIAMILGYYFRDEIITSQSMVAAVVMISGVFIINTNRLKKRKKTSRI